MMHGFKEHPEAKYGLETMCVGLGQGGAVIWKNLQRDGKKDKKEK
jgi:acetyl-CoA acyltransferase